MTQHRTEIFCLSSLLSLALALSGCATAAQNQPWRPDKLYEVETIAETVSYDDNGGFVYSGSSLFSPRRARRVGDMVTVLVVQETTADTTAGTSLTKRNESKAGIAALFGLETAVANIPNLPGGGPTLDLDASAENTFDGGGGTKRCRDLGTAVLPDGYGAHTHSVFLLLAIN